MRVNRLLGRDTRWLVGALISGVVAFAPDCDAGIVNTGNAMSNGTGTAASITHGLTINNGDVVVAFIAANSGGNTSTDNNGASAFAQAIQEDTPASAAGMRYAIFYRVAGASEPVSYAWTTSEFNEWAITIRVFSGVDTASVWDVAPSTSTRTGSTGDETTATAPSMTTVTAGAMGIAAFFTDGTGVTYSAPTNGYGTLVEQSATRAQASAVRTWSTAGVTGTTSATLSPANDWVAHQFALKPTTAIFYSVGTDTSDLKTGSPTITIATGLATLTASQTNAIGVGDVIDYDSPSKLAYIWDVVSATQFRVQTATGTLPGDIGPLIDVNTIKRAFNSITQAEAQSSDASHLSNASLVAAGRSLTWVCYNDGPLIEATTILIDGYTTDATHFITLTVAGASQVATGNSQRHNGTAFAGTNLTATTGGVLDVNDPYTVVEWLIFKEWGSGGTQKWAIDVDVNNGVHVRNNIFYGGASPHDTASAIQVDRDDHLIYNNIVYNLTGTAGGRGIWNDALADNVSYINNTVYNCRIGFQFDDAATDGLAINNISVGNTSDYTGQFHASSTNNFDSDGSAPPTLSLTTTPASLFVSLASPENLHLRPGATAIDAGSDQSGVFANDIDDQARPFGAAWEIGADETPFPAATTNYRSIGTAASYGVGTVNVTNLSDSVTGVGTAWLTNNRGRGDVITIPSGGVDYTILAVISDTSLRLTEAYTGSTGPETYLIDRQFATLAAWETCIDGNPCAFFPVASSSLVADDRNEVGIAYEDSPLASVTFTGATTDATHTITLTADGVNRHYGIPGAGVVVTGVGVAGLRVRDEFVNLEWIEVTGGTDEGIEFEALTVPNKSVVRNMLVHDVPLQGILLDDADAVIDVYNNIVYSTQAGLTSLALTTGTIRIFNNTFYNNTNDGIFAAGSNPTITLTNNISHSNGTDFDVSGRNASSRDNLASDGSGTTHSPAGGGQNFVALGAVNFVNAAGGDLHIQSVSAAENNGADLSGIFNFDIDGGRRQTPWDIGADDIAATTEVGLVSFVGTGVDGAVELTWETATELDNVGFHLYRATSPEEPLQRVTAQVIPGLSSSPAGATYRHVDDGLDNGVTYYYELEDIETTGRTERHGPVSATPLAGVAATESSSTRITYGEPETNELRIVKRTDRVVVVELVTHGFYAEPLEDGTVEVTIPEYLESEEASVPVKRFWLDLPFEREVKRVRVVEREVERFSGLTPAGLSAELIAERDGTVRAARRRRRARGNLLPERAARVVSQGFQGAEHKALLELAPLRFSEELVLSRRLVVRVVLGKRKVPGARAQGRASVRLVTGEPGLYTVRHRGRKVRLSRQGETVPYHRDGKTLYFLGEKDAVYELSNAPGAAMELVDATPSGPAQHYYWHTELREENRFYQAGLVNAPDIWLWDYLLSPLEKSFSFTVMGLASSKPATLRVWLQGISDFEHHVRFLVNGTFVGEARWNGKHEHVFEAETAVLEGTNTLTLESVGTTNSMVMLNRFEAIYPRRSIGELVGAWETGTAEVSGLEAAYVLDVSGENPKWIRGIEQSENRVRFRSEEGRRYLVAARAMAPELAPPRRSNLLKKTRRAQWILIGPEAFLDEARALVELRQAQGLRARAVSIESIYDEFGYGEPSPEAIRDYLSAVYHATGSLQYVVLLGDGTFDFEDFLGTGVQNQVPPMMVKTSYLWTASDPAYAAVNGDDLLPDIAIGRLPAASIFEARTMVQKILTFEGSETGLLDGPVVLIADNPDRAGDFVADADALAATLPSDKTTTKLYLPTATRQDIIRAFDDGAALMSYLGHGAIHLWADENIFNSFDVASLSSQSRQPLLLTMNCLNGYFHFPYFDSLAESLLKAEDKGVIAAFSPSGLSLNEPAKRYQEALVDELFHGGHERLGDAVLEAQKRYAETGAFPELLAIYHLFGDPALTIR